MRNWVMGWIGLALVACDRPFTTDRAEPGSGQQGPLEEVERILQVDPPTGPREPEPTATTESGKASVPVAEPVPKKPGFVISPYNGKWIDVTGANPGELMLDPHFDPSENKLFRVPEVAEPDEVDGADGEAKP